MQQIVKLKIFGSVIAWMYPVENQGRGLPHIHLLLTLSEEDKLLTSEDVENRGISARIPERDSELYDLVKRFMIHGPCGSLNPNSPCMEEILENGKRIRKCSKGYPKAFQEKTLVSENGLTLYARPDDDRKIEVLVSGNRVELDNRWVVPHNPYLLKVFRCHINLEKVNSISSVKYLHKYVHKPPDRARLELETRNDHDEVKEFIDARYVCPQEAVWRILELPMYDRSVIPCVMPMYDTRAEMVNSTIKRSEFWRIAKKYKLSRNMRALETEQEFAKDLIEIGNGNWNDENDSITLPSECISYGDLAEEIFANSIDTENFEEMANSAILAPKNIDVSEINSRVLGMLPGKEILYTSIDHAEDENRQRVNEYLDEYLYALRPNGFSVHELRLKKHAIVMLIRNLNIEKGLCNGTRMRVEEMNANLIVCRILTGDKAGQTAYIPRITLCCSEEYPFDLHRHQFPLVLAFAMTINKAQGQTLERVGIDLRNEVFGHGQLYVALSRARSWNMIKVKLDYSNSDRKIKNVVYKEILDERD
ncbi:hypothetical protein ACQ4LE_003592 [Meloidogyne hapla]